MHCVLNHAIDVVDATHASGEIYNVTYLLRPSPDGPQLDTWWGRYLDEYECRDGRWAISHRVCVHEWTSIAAARGGDADRRGAVPAGCGRSRALVTTRRPRQKMWIGLAFWTRRYC